MGRLAKWFACWLVGLALLAQSAAPAATAILTTQPVDPLAHFEICTSEGRVKAPDRQAPPQQHSCCDTLCQLAHLSHTLLAPPSVALAPPKRVADDVEFDLTSGALKLKPTFTANARAPPAAF